MINFMTVNDDFLHDGQCLFFFRKGHHWNGHKMFENFDRWLNYSWWEPELEQFGAMSISIFPTRSMRSPAELRSFRFPHDRSPAIVLKKHCLAKFEKHFSSFVYYIYTLVDNEKLQEMSLNINQQTGGLLNMCRIPLAPIGYPEINPVIRTHIGKHL